MKSVALIERSKRGRSTRGCGVLLVAITAFLTACSPESVYERRAAPVAAPYLSDDPYFTSTRVSTVTGIAAAEIRKTNTARSLRISTE
jgi:hypothetical protein